MKWLSITKDGVDTLSLKKTKQFTSIEHESNLIKFIHKKNPFKGKITSLKFSKPYNFNENTLYCVYYAEPLNKNFQDSDWTFKWKNEIIKTFNGIVVIQTTKSKKIDINDIIEFSDDDVIQVKESLLNCETKNSNIIKKVNAESKVKNNISEKIDEILDDKNEYEEGDDDDDDDDDIDEKNNDEEEILKDDDADDDDDDENEEGGVYNYADCDDEDSDKEDSFDAKSKKNKTTKSTKVPSKRSTTNHVDTLEVEQNHVLDFENYSYESDFVPNT